MDYALISIAVIAAIFFFGRAVMRTFKNGQAACCDKNSPACGACAGGAADGNNAGGILTKDRLRLLVTGVLAAVAVVLELHIWDYLHDLEFLLGIAAVVIGGYPLARNAFKGLKQKKLNVDALVIIAAVAALGLGEFLEAATVVFILLLGEELEAYTVHKAQTAVKGLAQLVPEQVRIRVGKNEEQLISLSEIKEGMIFIVKPGERIAVDGKVVAGNSSIDQSPITGESMPVERGPGMEVYSGSLNLDGALQIEATRVGDKTTIAHVKRLIEEARKEKAPIQRLVDKYANWFVPLILITGVMVYLLSGDLNRAITVLIVACPCAFVLGTPIAVVTTIGTAARKGILIKGGAALEACADLNSFVFDKTGTLTYGHPEIVKIKTFCTLDCANEDTLTFAAVAEKLSEHPLAEAILDKAKESELAISTPDDFLVKRGQGVVAHHEDIKIILGNRSLLKDNEINLSPEVEQYIKSREQAGETALLVAHNKQVCGVISLADNLRSNAAQTINELKKMGIDRTLAIYTGDNNEIARNMAEKLGMDEFAANLLPEQKVEKVKELIQRGYKVGMVGDGINDAPALASAHVGIAMGVGGSELAINAADVALLTDDLSKIPLIVQMGVRTFKIIKQNLWFAVIFNALMVYLASAGTLSMVGGALVHQLSSLGVILNSMRLVSPKETPL